MGSLDSPPLGLSGFKKIFFIFFLRENTMVTLGRASRTSELPDWKNFLEYLDYLNLNEPIIGLDYVEEIEPLNSGEGNIQLQYKCKLCNLETNMPAMACHVVGRKHRQKFLELKRPDLVTWNKYNINQQGKIVRAKAEVVERQQGRGLPLELPKPESGFKKAPLLGRAQSRALKRPVTRTSLADKDNPWEPLNKQGRVQKASYPGQHYVHDRDSHNFDSYQGRDYQESDRHRQSLDKDSLGRGFSDIDPLGQSRDYFKYRPREQGPSYLEGDRFGSKGRYLEEDPQRPVHDYLNNEPLRQHQSFSDDDPQEQGHDYSVDDDPMGYDHGSQDDRSMGHGFSDITSEDYQVREPHRRGYSSDGNSRRRDYSEEASYRRKSLEEPGPWYPTEKSGGYATGHDPEPQYDKEADRHYDDDGWRKYSPFENEEEQSVSNFGPRLEREWGKARDPPLRSLMDEPVRRPGPSRLQGIGEELEPKKRKRKSRFTDATETEKMFLQKMQVHQFVSERIERKHNQVLKALISQKSNFQIEPMKAETSFQREVTYPVPSNVLDTLQDITIENMEEANYLKQKLCDLLKDFQANKAERRGLGHYNQTPSPQASAESAQLRNYPDHPDRYTHRATGMLSSDRYDSRSRSSQERFNAEPRQRKWDSRRSPSRSPERYQECRWASDQQNEEPRQSYRDDYIHGSSVTRSPRCEDSRWYSESSQGSHDYAYQPHERRNTRDRCASPPPRWEEEGRRSSHSLDKIASTLLQLVSRKDDRSWP
ncbi:uncharacterized protein LOC114770330 isoform X2 [Denticeps clupeoides]|uniref:uncharacterized protein LOC114770330 isoform X2 n=1 Tax=Denticeps clupeoides TaxID=299321 RepID=UPI0010A32AC7|nr:uncharacterized protein LOC114770330 isoform X2 [Denticeps clupeoides]